MEASHLLVACSVYLLGLVCVLGYICYEIPWYRGATLAKIKQTVFYIVWVWSLLFMGFVNFIGGMPLVMMLVWALVTFFAAWLIRELLIWVVCVIRRWRNRKMWHR